MSSLLSKTHKKIKELFLDSEPIIKEEDLYFSNEILIDEFSQKLINELALYKKIIDSLKNIGQPFEEVEILEHNTFNILIRSIELAKNNSKVEVGVIGSFSSGKSTFINSLFKKSICPMSVKPTTSSITKFYYGAKEQITLNNEEITQSIYENIAQHLEKNTKNTQTNYIEYAYPFEAFNSIILYDTPGFNNNLNDNDSEVTMQTLKGVDVILFVVDISKGDIDKSSMELLETLKNKRIYCILNKSDSKSEMAVQKIKEEVISKKIFTEVIEYSALKVLEEGEKETFLNKIQEIEHQFLTTKKEFDLRIKGSIQEKKGRRITKKFYQFEIDKLSFIIDDFSPKAKQQREKVEKLLKNIAQNKQFELRNSFKRDKYKYEKKSLETLEKISIELASLEKSQQLLEFEKDLDIFYDACVTFQNEHIKSLYKEWNYAFVQSCTIQTVSDSEKSYWSTPYYKIKFCKVRFKEKIENLEFSIHMNNFMDKQINFFKEKWGWEPYKLKFKEDMHEEALYFYSSFYNNEYYLTLYSNSNSIYFDERHEARESLDSLYNIKGEENITTIYEFIRTNENYIEKCKQHLYSRDEKINNSMEELQTVINQFLKEEKNNVR